MEEKEEEFRGFNDDIELDPEDFEEEEEGDDKSEPEEEKSKPAEEKSEEAADVKGDEEEEEEAEEEETEAVKKAKEAEKNHYFAEKRKAKEEAERKAKEDEIKRAAKLEAELGVITKNPYTEKPIKDEADLEAYKMMKEIDEAGGDPIADFPEKAIAKARKEVEERKKADEAAKEKSKKIASETEELAKTYPNVDLAKLADDKEFIELCETKGGRWTMTECYEFLESKRATAKKEEKSKKENEAAEEVAKKFTSTPSSKSNGGKSSKSYLEMTDEEYIKLQKEESGDFFA